MLPLQSLDSQSYEEIRDQLLAKLKSQCPHWPIDHASDPARVFVELFSWLSEQSQFRLGHRSDDDIRRLYQSFGFQAKAPQCAQALCQFSLDDESSSSGVVPAGTKLSTKEHGQDVVFQTTDELALHRSQLKHLLSIVENVSSELDTSGPWQPFQRTDPTGVDLYLQDPLLESLLGDGEVTIPFADSNAAKRAADWRWELWHDEKWNGLSVLAGEENLTLDFDPQLQRLPNPRKGTFPSQVLEQLQADQWTIRAQVPGKDRSLVTNDFQPQIWARQSHLEVSLGEQENGEHSYSWSIQNIPENASLGARLQALDLGEHPDLLASLEWVGSKQSTLIASLAEDRWMIEDPSRGQFSARHDSGEWHFYWQVPEDWDHEEEATLQLTLSYDYAPDGGAFVEVLAAHAEPLPERLICTMDTLSSVKNVQRSAVFDESRGSEDPQDSDGLYLGFDRWTDAQSATFYFELAHKYNQPLSSAPSILWESWNGSTWTEVAVVDRSRALTSSGLIQIGPCASVEKELHGRKSHWFRGTVTEGAWLCPPTIQKIYPNAVWAVEGRRIDRECVGRGDGVASLSLSLKEPTVCAILAVVSADSNDEESAWEPVADFLESGPTDRHYVFDGEHSALVFGDGLRGKIPELGLRIFVSYKVSVGALGHIEAQRLQVVDPQKALGFHGTNLRRAFGAEAREDLAALIARSKGSIQPERAITVADYERLACASSPLVARASCSEEGGEVRVRVLPRRDVLWTVSLQDHVQAYLDERKILTTQCKVEGPKQREFTVEVRIRPEQAGSAAVQNRFMGALSDYFEWWSGGVDGTGWRFGETINAADCLRYLGDRGLARGVLDLKFKVPGSPPSFELILPLEALPRCAAVKVVGN